MQQASIANALLNMVIQGLSPAKTQCYFVVYGTELKMIRSYHGTEAIIKRLPNIKDIWANVIFEGDKFKYENRKGKDYLLIHDQELENRDNPVVGAYAIVEKEDGDMPMTVMTRKEIETAWEPVKDRPDGAQEISSGDGQAHGDQSRCQGLHQYIR